MGGVYLPTDDLGFTTRPMFVYVSSSDEGGREHAYTFGTRCLLCGSVANDLEVGALYDWTLRHVPDLSGVPRISVTLRSRGGGKEDGIMSFQADLLTSRTRDPQERSDALLARVRLPAHGQVGEREAARRLRGGDFMPGSMLWKERLRLCRPVRVEEHPHTFEWASEPERSLLRAAVSHMYELSVLARYLQNRMMVRAAVGAVPVDVTDYVLIEAITCAAAGRALFLPGPAVPWDQGGLGDLNLEPIDGRCRYAPAYIVLPQSALRAAFSVVQRNCARLEPWRSMRLDPSALEDA